jgi:alpha-beta hydrolase superfamily lysophospholipase
MIVANIKHLRYALPLGGALLAGALGVAAYAAHIINGPRRRNPGEYAFTPWEVQVDHERISFQSEDGVTIRGWWFSRPESQRVVIGLHGHRGAKTDLLGIGSGLWRAGNNVLLFDFRGCGESDHGPQSLAHNEQRDARAAVRYAQARLPGANIGMIGYSMGASIAILVAAAEPAIKAVAADSPFATMRDVVADAYVRRRVPTRPILDLTDALTRWRYGYPFHAVRPIDVVGAIAPRPFLLMHGTADTVIPIRHAHQLYEAAGDPKELVVYEGATHCGGYFADRPAYVGRVAAFFANAFG